MATKRKQTKMEKAREIVRKCYASNSKTPRKDAIEKLMASTRKGGLGMAPTTAATYHAHCIAYFREQQENEALEKAEKGKPVWTVFKVNKDAVVTSAGHFLTKKAASEFNSTFRHDGVVKGLVNPGDVVEDLKQTKAA